MTLLFYFFAEEDIQMLREIMSCLKDEHGGDSPDGDSCKLDSNVTSPIPTSPGKILTVTRHSKTSGGRRCLVVTSNSHLIIIDRTYSLENVKSPLEAFYTSLI